MKELDKCDSYVRKVIQGAELETLPANFTEKVKQQILAFEGQRSQIAYQPLITKKGWIAMAICILTIYGITLTQTKSFLWVKSAWTDLGSLSESGMLFLSQVGLSGFFVNLLLYFFIVSFVVILFLKHNLNRRYRFSGIA